MDLGSPRPAIDPSPLGSLGVALDADGFTPHELAVRRVVRAAWASGVARTAADVLADSTAPDVARMRAFAVVSSALAAVAGTPGGRVVRPVA